MPEFLIAVLLGVLEGLTEFIPVSSTGHLILCEYLLDFNSKKAETFIIFIQLGAILAVVFLYLNRFFALLRFGKADDSADAGFNGLRGIISLGLVSLPALIMGALFHDYIKNHLFSPEMVAYALIFGGVVMMVVDTPSRNPKINRVEDIGFLRAFFIGIFQCFSLWPGMSRSGSTIVGGMLLGLDRRTAAEYSFLSAVPIMCAAVGFDLLKSLDQLGVSDILTFAIGFVTAFVSAALAIQYFISLLNRVSLQPFAWYRVVVGILVLWLSWG